MIFLSRGWFVAVIIPLLPLALACQRREGGQYQTCTVCGSTRVIDSRTGERILYRSAKFAHGEHVWRDGISLAVPYPVPSGVVVLARRVPPDSDRANYGAFILTSQTSDPERVSYRWYLRSDGSGLLDPNDPSVRSGEERDQKRLESGPFKISWSGSAEGAGYVYYDNFAHMPAEKNTTYICVTAEKDITGVNAADAKWVYKFSPAE
jgi:hypothetical protein